jgi:hypothetical protein
MDGIKLHRIVCRSFLPGAMIDGMAIPMPDIASNDGEPASFAQEPGSVVPSFAPTYPPGPKAP